MVVMRYVECQLCDCVNKTLPYYGYLPLLSHSAPPPPLFSLLPLYLPPLTFPPSLLLPPSLLPLPTQGDNPLNSADDDEDSDGEGAHFDTEDNIVCQFEKVRCSPEYFRVQVIHF